MELLRDTPFEVAFVVTPLRPPRPTLTVVVKATFTLPHEGACAVAPEQLPVSGDAHVDDDPAKPLRYESDLAPAKPCGECLVLGSCHPPGGAVAHSAVAFAVGAVKKRIAVFGDRRWGAWPARAPGEPAPFTSMPLVWERAAGGVDDPRNPLGRSGRGAALPNLEDPGALVAGPDDRPAPAGCGPIARTWAARTRHAGTFDGAWQRDRWPFLPADHGLAYHLAAPADQRVEGFWSGDEEVTLRNLRPGRELVRARLPGLTARAFVLRSADGEPEALPMRLDTIVVDADAARVIALWRGATEVASDRLEDLHGVLVWHEPLAARSGVAEARARLAAARAKEEAERAGFAPEPVPEADDEDDESLTATVKLPARDEATAKAEAEGAEVVAKAVADAEGALAEAAAAGVAMDAPGPPPEGALREALAALGMTPEQLGVGDAEPAVDVDEAAEPSARARLLEALAGGGAAGMDLTGADLTGTDLTGADLTGCLLAGADLTGARLDRATLARAALAGAVLTRATLDGADLTGADLTGARGEAVSLRGAVLTAAVLTGASLAGAAMGGCRLDRAEARDAVLTGADLAGAVLDGADLSGARLDRARAPGASLVGASLEGARAPGIDLTGADVTRLRASERADLTGAVLREAKGARGIYLDAALDGADLSYGDFSRSDFSGAKLAGARLDGCDLRNARAVGAVLAGAVARRADAMEINLEGADLADADLRGTNLYGAALWRARAHGARFDQAILDGTLLAGAAPSLGAR